jgi:hypothetical protein
MWAGSAALPSPIFALRQPKAQARTGYFGRLHCSRIWILQDAELLAFTGCPVELREKETHLCPFFVPANIQNAVIWRGRMQTSKPVFSTGFAVKDQNNTRHTPTVDRAPSDNTADRRVCDLPSSAALAIPVPAGMKWHPAFPSYFGVIPVLVSE